LPEIAFAGAVINSVVRIPIMPPSEPFLQVNIETARNALEGKGGRIVEPAQPRISVFWPKGLRKLTLRVQVIAAMILGPDECMKRDSGHTIFLLPVLFSTALPFLPTTLPFLPTERSIAETMPANKELNAREGATDVAQHASSDI